MFAHFHSRQFNIASKLGQGSPVRRSLIFTHENLDRLSAASIKLS